MRGDSDFEPGDFDPRGLWQAQTKEYDPMTLADIHRKARKFESRIQRRNAIEYAACGVVLVGFTPALLNRHSWLMQAGAAWVILATLFVAWQLHRRTSIQASPEPGETLVDSYRRQLIRQRDAIATVGRWYIAPVLPGLGLIMAGRWFQAHLPNMSIERDHAGILTALAVAAVVMTVIWLLNKRGARRLQKMIDDL